MTMRGCLLLLLLPTMTLCIVVANLLFYFDNIFIAALVSLALLWILLFFIAKGVSKPIEELKDAALEMAAGNCDIQVRVKGQKEVEELAGALNTMNACIKEQISEQQREAFTKELSPKEQECTQLFKGNIIQYILAKAKDFPFSIQYVEVPSTKPRGLVIEISGRNFHLFQAKEPLLPAFVALVTESKEHFPAMHLHIKEDGSCMFERRDLPPPYIQNEYLFVYNFDTGAFIEMTDKVLKHFAEQGLEAISSLLEKELLFFSRKRNSDEDLFIFCMKRKSHHVP